MNFKSKLKYLWSAVGGLSVVLLAFHWFGFDGSALKNTILVLNALMFILSAPCSLFVIPVLVSANYFMALSPFSAEGIYLNTTFLFVVGLMQWFWIVRFWSPTEPQLQTLEFSGANPD